MAISGINFGGTGLTQSTRDLKDQLSSLQTQLTSGKKSTTYSGMGVNEGFAIAARAQLSSLNAFTDSQSKVNTIVGVTNTALQSLVSIGNQVKNGAAQASQTVGLGGQTVAQQSAAAQFSTIVDILNTQAGDRYVFSGSDINTPSVASADSILNGSGSAAGVKQVIAERKQADLGASGLGRLTLTQPTTTSVAVGEDVAGSPFGFKLASVSSSLTGATVRGPTVTAAGAAGSAQNNNRTTTAGTTTGTAVPGASSGATLISALTTTPTAGQTITVNNTTFTITASGGASDATHISVDDTLTSLLTKVGAAAGGSATLSGGQITVNGASGASVTLSGTALGAFGLTANTYNGTAPAAVTSSTQLAGAASSSSDALTTAFTTSDTIVANSTTIRFYDSGAGGSAGTAANSVYLDLASATVGDLTTAINTATGGTSAIDATTGAITLTTGTAADIALSGTGVTKLGLGTTYSQTRASAPTISVSLGSNPNNGDSVTFKFNLPDGTSEQISLTASSAVPTPAGSFAIGATSDVTAANLNTALNSSIGTLAKTSLVAASAVQGSKDFFGSPPQRVSGTPLNAATSLVAGTPANTVQWYTGEAGSGSARASATTRIDSSVTVQYGARANEDAIRNQLQTIAAFAAVTTSASDPNSSALVSALSQRTTVNLTAQPGQQAITDIQADFSNAQLTVDTTKARQTQTGSALQDIVDQAENVSSDEVATKILALQNALSASYQTTSMLAQLSLTKFL